VRWGDAGGGVVVEGVIVEMFVALASVQNDALPLLLRHTSRPAEAHL